MFPCAVQVMNVAVHGVELVVIKHSTSDHGYLHYTN